jgi:crotonobetainyl-CoA:carnitine CoA-transferase CaiB-like acyl-CoA transferase
MKRAPCNNHMDTSLANIYVVDFTEALAGPICGMILGDLGAEVVKIERPGRGDQARGYGPPFADGESAYFMSVNRNKRSLTLDITSGSGQEVMQRLLRRADIFLLNLPRRASWQKYGFDYETVAAGNPGIIYAAVSGYGHTGPRAGEPGYDVIAQAESGTMSLTGEPGGAPMRFPTPMADMSTGLYATIGVLAALQARRQNGRGQLIDLSLLECQTSWLTSLVPAYLLSGEAPARLGNAHPMLAPYRLYQARDRAINIGVGSDSLWQRFCQAIERPDLAADPRFSTNPERVRHRHLLEPILDEILRQRDAAGWLARLREARVPCGLVNTLPEILEDEHFRARGGLKEVAHPTLGALPMLASPLHFSATAVTYRRPPPRLGEHSEEILTELGYDPGQITGMRREGII